VLEGGVDAVPSVAPFAVSPAPRARTAGERFHDALRSLEANRFATLLPSPPGALRAPALPRRAPKPDLGETRTFSVCATLEGGCSQFDPVIAIARAVGEHLVIFVDVEAPPAGLVDEDLDTLITMFDERLYGLDRDAFGAESDIDGDGVVHVLMTAVVNRLVTEEQCLEDGFVVGFTVGADIDPLFATDPRVNHAEVFYSIVPDPDGTLSCAHSRAQVKRILPVTFIHEFQHMISYNHHVLVRDGDPEVLWLNEALSHYAEELGGESFLAEGDTSRFQTFLLGNLFNAKDYLTAPENYFLFPSEGIGSLVERGAGWLYLRYLIDQYAADTTLTARNAFTRALVATANTGSANIVARTGTTIDTSATRWALANWVDDLPGLTPPPELQYAFWDLRYWYGKLHNENMAQFPTAFPLAPPMAPGNVTQAAGVLRSGSPVYRRATSAPGAPSFTLRFGTERLTLFATSLRVRVSIVRTR
jgi:hypothetical protein